MKIEIFAHSKKKKKKLKSGYIDILINQYCTDKVTISYIWHLR